MKLCCRKSRQDSEAQYRFLFTENPQPMWVFDLAQCRFLAVNKAALRHYGFSAEEFMRLTAQDLLPAEQVDAFMKEVAQPCSHAESRSCWKHYRKDQSVIDVELAMRDLNYAGAPARLVVVNDLTQMRRREEQALQAHKMELISRIAGGVAPPRPLDLNRLINNLSLILRRVAGEKVLFQNLCGQNPLPIIGDPKVLEQVLMSLVKNSRDALAEKGTVTVSTAVVRVPQPPLRENPESSNTEFVRINVRDNGCGMPPEVQERLFEPFFTTKAPDKGQGLGLACVFGAVRQHWGWVEWTSTFGAGTEFRIFLPCVSPSLLPSVTEMQAATNVNRGTVLLVDPDDRSRGVARYVLNRNGYRVIEADSSAIALVLWEGQARNIDVVLTDLALPGSSGFDLGNQLRQTRPNLKVIYACANEAELNSGEAGLSEETKWVAKPYRSDQLVETIETLLPQKSGK
jgi:two-component system, cell cycle sensor histidine kinase and response regulator CckA